jgi:hypothetical protein
VYGHLRSFILTDLYLPTPAASHVAAASSPLLDELDSVMGDLAAWLPNNDDNNNNNNNNNSGGGGGGGGECVFALLARAVFRCVMEAMSWVLAHRGSLTKQPNRFRDAVAHGVYTADVHALSEMFAGSVNDDDIIAFSAGVHDAINRLCLG